MNMLIKIFWLLALLSATNSSIVSDLRPHPNVIIMHVNNLVSEALQLSTKFGFFKYEFAPDSTGMIWEFMHISKIARIRRQTSITSPILVLS